MTQFRMSLNWFIVAILLVVSFDFNASETGSEVEETPSTNSSISRNRRCSLVGRQCRLRLVAPCPARICRPSETFVREEIRHISSAPIVHEVHHQRTSSYSNHRVEELVQRPVPIIQQKVEHIIQEPVPIIQQKVEQIVQEPVIQQKVEHIIQEPVPIVQETQQIVQEHLPIIQQRVEQIHIHKPVVSLRITACPEGHYLSPDGTHCKHIDCERGLEFSDTLLRCVDINECLVSTACLSDEQCINTYASYICRKICTQAGHRLNEARNTCEDIDECIEGLHGCGPQQNCINTPGSYRCECPAGYRISGSRCEDINECLESHQHLCPYDTSLCENVPGSFYCKCRPGFEKNFKGICADVDECSINNGGCSQRCVNKFGSFECHCNNGYKLGADSRTCIDIDECVTYAETGICSPQTSTCENTPGSYRCRCKIGFRDPDGQGKHCADLDECLERTNLCEQRCLNSFGSYKCSCNRGYRLVDAHRCEDIDECHEGDVINSISYSRFYHSEDGHPKLCQGSCENTAGSYHCRCPHGYNLVHNHHCVDIDECSEHGYCKGANQTCVNIGGSFRCVDTRCPPGYYREGSQCKFKERLVYAEICDDPTETCDIDQIICYSYAYIAFRSKMVQHDQSKGTARGHEFFTFVVPVEPPIIVDFKFRMVTVKSPRNGVRPAVKDDFEMRRTKDNEVRLAIQSPLEGPQDIELEIEARMYKNGLQIGKNIAIVTVFISEYEF